MCSSFLFTVPYLLHNGASPSTIVDHGGNFETWNFRQFSTRIFLPSSRRIIYPFLHSYLAIFTRVFVDKWVDEDKSMIERS